MIDISIHYFDHRKISQIISNISIQNFQKFKNLKPKNSRFLTDISIGGDYFDRKISQMISNILIPNSKNFKTQKYFFLNRHFDLRSQKLQRFDFKVKTKILTKTSLF